MLCGHFETSASLESLRGTDSSLVTRYGQLARRDIGRCSRATHDRTNMEIVNGSYFEATMGHEILMDVPRIFCKSQETSELPERPNRADTGSLLDKMRNMPRWGG